MQRAVSQVVEKPFWKQPFSLFSSTYQSLSYFFSRNFLTLLSTNEVSVSDISFLQKECAHLLDMPTLLAVENTSMSAPKNINSQLCSFWCFSTIAFILENLYSRLLFSSPSVMMTNSTRSALSPLMDFACTRLIL